jgi:hypothetical protein
MKKLITTCALLMAVSAVTFAQTSTAKSRSTAAKSVSTSAEQLSEKRAKFLQEKLGLNADQYALVYAAELDYQKLVKEAKDGGYQLGEGQAMQAKMSRDARFQNTMTPAQYSTYETTMR